MDTTFPSPQGGRDEVHPRQQARKRIHFATGHTSVLLSSRAKLRTKAVSTSRKKPNSKSESPAKRCGSSAPSRGLRPSRMRRERSRITALHAVSGNPEGKRSLPQSMTNFGIGTLEGKIDHGRQPSQSHIASPMISRLSSSGIQSIAWKCVTHSVHEHGILVMSVPQKSRRGPKASYMAR